MIKRGEPVLFDTLIVHGSFADPTHNWFPWLSAELTEQGRRVLVPQFPDRDFQNYANWSKVLDTYRDYMSDEPIIYAHSISPAFVVDYCVLNALKPRKAVLVAPFYEVLDRPDLDDMFRSFFMDEAHIEKFGKICEEVICVYSDDDPYIPREMSEKFARLAGARSVIVPGGKHLTTGSGFREFPQLLKL